METLNITMEEAFEYGILSGDVGEEATPKEDTPKYTLEEAKELLKKEGYITLEEAKSILKKQDYLPLEEVVSLVVNASKAWEEIKDDEVCLTLVNNYLDNSLYGDEDFEDLDHVTFIKACKAVVTDYNCGNLEIPDDIEVDEDVLEDHFRDNIDDFWYYLRCEDSISKDFVKEHYLENGDVDMDEYVSKINLNNY